MQLPQLEPKKNSILPQLAVGTFCLHLFTILLLMFHGSMLKQLRRQLIPQSLVQLADGRAITVEPKQNLERHPETIRRFVGETISLMLTWSPQQPPKKVWSINSELLADDFQPKAKSEIFNLNSDNQVENVNRGTENVLIIQKISQPTPIKDGKWKVEMFANQLMFSNSDKLGKSIPFNKQIFVRAIDRPGLSLPDTKLPWYLAAYRLSEARLEIYDIRPIEEENGY